MAISLYREGFGQSLTNYGNKVEVTKISV